MRLPAEPQSHQPMSARWGQAIVRWLRSCRLQTSADIMVSTSVDGTTLSLRRRPVSAGASLPWNKLALGYLLSGNICTVYPGAVRRHGIDICRITSSVNIELSGVVEWIYAEIERESPLLSIKHSATEPETTSTHLRIPLYKFAATDGKYSLERICNIGDVNFDTPIK